MNNNDDNGDRPTRDAHGRWLKGHCPNRTGRRGKKRPKERLSQWDLGVFGNTLIDVVQNGRKEEMLRREALLNKIFETAMKGRVSMQRFLYEKIHEHDKLLAAHRVRYDRLIYDWYLDNPRLHDRDFEMPMEVENEILALRSMLEFYHPGAYSLSPEYNDDIDDDDAEVEAETETDRDDE